MPNEEEFHTSAMVDAVRDMSRKLEQYQRHADDERKKMLGDVNATVAGMRQDFWKTTIAIQRDQAQHRDEHTAERKERAADVVVRSHRQTTHDVWMIALTVLGAINLAVTGYLAVQLYLVGLR